MKGILSNTILVIGIIALLVGSMLSYGMVSYAGDLELIGEEASGLVVLPDSKRLFDLTNMNPGDTYEAKLVIRNKYTDPFQLFMKAERMEKAPNACDADLFQQLHLTIFLGDEKIYSGSMMDFAAANTGLGEFKPGDKKNLKAIVHLPGPETGNEYQEKCLEVKWIFTAQSEKFAPIEDDPQEPDGPDKPEPKDPILPKTGQRGSMVFYLIGIGLLALGIGIGLEYKKK